MHSLYIIYSKKLDRYYTGETNDMQARLKKHNDHSYKYAFTTAASDWEVKLVKEIENKEKAVYLEKFRIKNKSCGLSKYIIPGKPRILKKDLLY